MKHVHRCLLSKTVRALLLVLLLAIPTREILATLSPHQKATILLKPSVVSIRTTFHPRVMYTTEAGTQSYGPYEILTQGTGLLVAPDGLVLTTAHVVDPPTDLHRRATDRFLEQMTGFYEREAGHSFDHEERRRLARSIREKGEILVTNGSETPDGGEETIPRSVRVLLREAIGSPVDRRTPMDAEVLASSPFEARDLALLRIPGEGYPTAILGDSDRVQLQDPVTVIGAPVQDPALMASAPLPPTYSTGEVVITQGIISSLRTWADGSTVFGTDAIITRGSSGGPALNRRGEVIGILSTGALTPERRGAGFNFIRPVNQAMEFLAEHQLEPRRGPTDPAFERAVGLYWSAEELREEGQLRAARAGYRQARASLLEVLKLFPAHPDARTYLLRSEDMLSRLPDSTWPPVWALITLAALPTAAIIGFLLLHRSTPTRSSPRSWMLVVEAGDLAGRSFPVPVEGLVLGRDPARCQIVYGAETVSREHARVMPGPSDLVITNLSTTNPTYVNERAIAQTRLHPGDTIRISKLVLRVDASENPGHHGAS